MGVQCFHQNMRNLHKWRFKILGNSSSFGHQASHMFVHFGLTVTTNICVLRANFLSFPCITVFGNVLPMTSDYPWYPRRPACPWQDNNYNDLLIIESFRKMRARLPSIGAELHKLHPLLVTDSDSLREYVPDGNAWSPDFAKTIVIPTLYYTRTIQCLSQS